MKQVQTCLGLGLFFLKPQEPLKSAGDPDGETDREEEEGVERQLLFSGGR